MVHFFDETRCFTTQSKKLVLAGLSLNCALKVILGLLSKENALGLQREVDSQHIEFRVDFDIARIRDVESIKGLVVEFCKFEFVLRNYLRNLLKQREDIKSLQNTTVK
jgi:hypothetical protein